MLVDRHNRYMALKKYFLLGHTVGESGTSISNRLVKVNTVKNQPYLDVLYYADCLNQQSTALAGKHRAYASVLKEIAGGVE